MGLYGKSSTSVTCGAQHVRRRARAPDRGKQTMRGSPLRPRARQNSLHWLVGRASAERGATLTLVAPASESPLAFMVLS
jgi:hypothetical protein